ncbi:MAG: bifunctional 4-hydroxy-2-oxoglutarate aldolase/2-dehydro-3-deoxy-phosphogluconate aldolase [Candidatus Omnitrophota bacterium]
MDTRIFEDLPLIGILRGIKPDDAEPLIEAVVRAGLPAVEVTLNTPGSMEIISRMKSASRGRISIGAGTVLSVKGVRSAVSAGAEFIVMPVADEDVVSECVKKGILAFPGAFTPSEIFRAWKMGAYMVKVFPSGMFGPKYIKEVKAPLDDIRVIAVGGVRPDNIEEYFSSGASAVAFGASVFRKEWLDNRDFLSIENRVASYVNGVRAAVSRA